MQLFTMLTVVVLSPGTILHTMKELLMDGNF